MKASDALVLFLFCKSLNGNFPLTWEICFFTPIKPSTLRTERVTLSKQATAPSSLTHTETIWTKHSDKSFLKKKPPTSWNKLPDRITQNDLSNVLETARKIFKSRQRGGNVDPSGIHLWLIFSPSSFSSYKTQEQIVHWGFQAASSPTESPEISKDQVTVRSESWSCPLKPGLDPFVQFSSCLSQ